MYTVFVPRKPHDYFVICFFVYLVSAFECSTTHKNGSNSNQPPTHTHSHVSHKYRILFVYTFRLSFFRLFHFAFLICCRFSSAAMYTSIALHTKLFGFFWHPCNSYREKVKTPQKSPKANIMEICLHFHGVQCFLHLSFVFVVWQKNASF